MIFCLLVLALAASPAAPAQTPAVEKGDAPTAVLSSREAHAKAVAGDLVLIDIRTPDEWRETGVPASGHTITMHQSQQTFLRELGDAVGGSRQRPIALICAVGNRSAFLRGWLRRAGFENVIDVSEGMIGGRRGPGWIKSGLPLRRWSAGSTKPQPGAQ